MLSVGWNRVAGMDVGEEWKSSGGDWVFIADGCWDSSVGVLPVGVRGEIEE